jgi:TetR/AcrR family transcriptional regulator, copper-responsive repressor
MVQKESPSPELTKDPSKARGRPKAYDRDTALKAMRNVFWAHGYAATSLDDLSASSGMNRPSLYNAFGDKAGVFMAVLDDYVDQVRAVYQQVFWADLPLDRSLRHIYETVLKLYTSREGPRGCFIVGVALTQALNDEAIAQRVRTSLAELDAAFLRRLQKAQNAGELSAGADLDMLASLASATHSALSVRARAGVERAQLDRLIDSTIRAICREN